MRSAPRSTPAVAWSARCRSRLPARGRCSTLASARSHSPVANCTRASQANAHNVIRVEPPSPAAATALSRLERAPSTSSRMNCTQPRPMVTRWAWAPWRTRARRSSYAAVARRGWPAASRPSPRIAADSMPAGESLSARLERAVGPGHEFVAAATNQRMQHVTLGDQRGRVRITLGVDDVPCTPQSDLGLCGAATKDGQVGKGRVSQRRLAQALHRRHFRSRCHAVARGDQRIDRAREPLVVLKRIGGEPRRVAEQRRRLRPCALGAALVRQARKIVGECRNPVSASPRPDGRVAGPGRSRCRPRGGARRRSPSRPSDRSPLRELMNRAVAARTVSRRPTIPQW